MQNKRELFLEKDWLEPDREAGRLVLREQRVSLPGSQWLDRYRYGWSPLYLDKKGFAAHLMDEMEKRFVYQVEERTTEILTGHGAPLSTHGEPEENDGPEELDEAVKELYSEKIAELREQIAEIDSDLEESLDRHEDRWDMLERIGNNSFYTSRQQWLLGEMDTEEYFHDDTVRSLARSNITSKAFQKKSDLEYQIHRLQQEMKDAQNALLQKKRERQRARTQAQVEEMESRPTYERKSVTSICVQAEVLYCQGTLMAIYVPEEVRDSFEITAGDGWNGAELSGRIFNMREMEGKKAGAKELLTFLHQQYAPAMERARIPKKKPEGLTEEAWRLWQSLCQEDKRVGGR